MLQFQMRKRQLFEEGSNLRNKPVFSSRSVKIRNILSMINELKILNVIIFYNVCYILVVNICFKIVCNHCYCNAILIRNSLNGTTSYIHERKILTLQLWVLLCCEISALNSQSEVFTTFQYRITSQVLFSSIYFKITLNCIRKARLH